MAKPAMLIAIVRFSSFRSLAEYCSLQNTGKTSSGMLRHLRLMASSSPLFLIV